MTVTTVLTLDADEESTYVIDVAFTNEDDVAVVPDSLDWKLVDEAGVVVDSALAVGGLASTMTFAFFGPDLAIADTTLTDIMLYFRIDATYTSSIGAGLPLTAEASFSVRNHKGQV